MSRLKIGDLVTVNPSAYGNDFYETGCEYPVTSIDGTWVMVKSKKGASLALTPGDILRVTPVNIAEPTLTADEYIAKIHGKQADVVIVDEIGELMKTEGVKADAGKAPITLIDPEFLFGLAEVMDFGARKYAAHNWRKGMRVTRVLDASLRHMLQFLNGEDIDAESGKSHLYHAAFGLMVAAKMHKTRPDLDDRYTKAQA